MAYSGGIDYLKMDFGEIEWKDIESPWSREGEYSKALGAEARVYDRGKVNRAEDSLVFDTPAGSERVKSMCVVLVFRKDQ